MATVITNIGRNKIAKARAGLSSLPAITEMAFGTGGLVSGQPRTPAATENTLQTEVFRKVIDATSTDERIAKYHVDIATNELNNVQVTELGIFDSEGDMILIKTFPAKAKLSGQVGTWEISDTY